MIFAVCVSALAADAISHAGPADRTLRLAEFVFDPAQGEPVLPEGWDRSSTAGPDLHLVQFDGPITDEGLNQLREDGLEPVQYIYPNAYVVWGRSDDRRALDGRPSIRWSGEFAPAYRVQPQWRTLEGTVDVRVLLVRDADPDAAIDAIEGLGGVLGERFVINDKLEVGGVLLPGHRMQAAAAIPGVYSIQVAPTDWGSRAEVSAQINAGNVDGSNLPVPGYPAWLSALGLDGSGVVVGHVDEGFQDDHPDLIGRVMPCSGTTCSATQSSHGTHTAGILAGDGASAVLDDNGFLRGQGMAPGVGLVEQLYFPTLLQPGGMYELMRQSVVNGAVMSNNSWGRSTFAWGYDIHTLMVDAGVRDADPDTPGDQPLIYVQALDNGDGGTSSQGVPDDAKNILSVGATRALTIGGDPDPNYNDLSDVTGHGPALDGRTIPHLVAPGCRVDSAVPTGGGFDHGTKCGTSMAAAGVSGAVTLFLEYYRGLAGTTGDPSPALVKSAFFPVAHDLDGQLDADGGTLGHRPDSKQGWGRMDMAAVVDPPAGSVLYFDQQQVFDFTGEDWMRLVTPVDPAEPMRIMLVWTDAPGHGLGGATPAWNNDLDLEVEVGVDIYLGNVFGVDGLSATGGAADTMNNMEGVFLPAQAEGSHVALRVLATNINSDALPNQGDGTDQDFALTCYNCELVPTFALSSTPASVDLCAPTDAEFQINVEQLSGYASPVTLSSTGAPSELSLAFADNPVVPGGTSLLTVSDTGAAASGDYTIQVQGDSVDWNRATSVQVRLRAAPPEPAVLTTPADATVDVEPIPLLAWDAVAWTDHYLVEVAEDAAFQQLVYHAVTTGTSKMLPIALAQQETYYWRVRATNACGFGDFSSGSSFTTRDVVPLLLVDDDGDFPDVQAFYTNALDALGRGYDIWDVWGVHGGNEPDEATLALYDQLIWFTGEEDVYAGPDSATEPLLADWLDRSGCWMISSVDYIFNGGFDDFVKDRFGINDVDEDTGQTIVTGQGSVFAGLGPYALTPEGSDFSDSLFRDGTSEVAFVGEVGTAAVDKDTGYYRTCFAGYALEREPQVPPVPMVQETLDAFLGWCDSLPALDGDMDGVANVDDCVAGDADVWSAPYPVDGLMLAEEGFFWSQPVSGSGAVYDVLRSLDPEEYYDSTCVAVGTVETSSPADPVVPAPGETFFYLVGARNECGLSTLGQNLDGTARYGTACE
jgi:hypothetical protein